MYILGHKSITFWPHFGTLGNHFGAKSDPKGECFFLSLSRFLPMCDGRPLGAQSGPKGPPRVAQGPQQAPQGRPRDPHKAPRGCPRDPKGTPYDPFCDSFLLSCCFLAYGLLFLASGLLVLAYRLMLFWLMGCFFGLWFMVSRYYPDLASPR